MAVRESTIIVIITTIWTNDQEKFRNSTTIAFRACKQAAEHADQQLQHLLGTGAWKEEGRSQLESSPLAALQKTACMGHVELCDLCFASFSEDGSFTDRPDPRR